MLLEITICVKIENSLSNYSGVLIMKADDVIPEVVIGNPF